MKLVSKIITVTLFFLIGALVTILLNLPTLFSLILCGWFYGCIYLFIIYFYKPKSIQPFNSFIVGLNDNYKNFYAHIVDYTQGDSSKEFTPHDIAIAYPYSSYSKSNFQYLYDKGFLERGSRGKYVIASGKFNLFKQEYDKNANKIKAKNTKMANKKTKIFGGKGK